MKERDFGGLIVRHRKSAVFFMREADLTAERRWRNPFKEDEPERVYIASSQLDCEFHFDKENFEELLAYLEQIAAEAWKVFNPKEVDSMGADYWEYYDKEFDNNGYASIGKFYIKLEGPNQELTSDPIIRLYKFNKRKFESFIYDLREALAGEPNAI